MESLKNTDHLAALWNRLINETIRLEQSTGKEKKVRQHIVDMVKKEIKWEEKFLGMSASLPAISEDDLLAELFS